MSSVRHKVWSSSGQKIRLRLLGKFAAQANEQNVLVPSAKGRLLCALLAVRPNRLSARKQLAALLWEDRPSEQALVSLRQELSRLRSNLGSHKPADWQAGPQIVLPPYIEVDVVHLLAAIAEADAVKVAERYTGSFMEGEDFRGKRLNQWLTKTRRDIARASLAVCEACLAQNEQLSAQEEEKVAAFVVRINPEALAASVVLIKAYAAQGKTAHAIEFYRELTERFLKTERRVPTLLEQTIAQVFERSRQNAPKRLNEVDDLNWIDEINQQHYEAASPTPRPLSPPRDRPSLAVLPFRDVSHSANPFHGLEDGITEEITTALASLRTIFVTSGRSAQVYKYELKDVRQISVELGVAYLVEGSIEVAANDLRVYVRLIDGVSGLSVWGDVLHDKVRRFPEIRNRIVAGLIARLQPTIMQHEAIKALRQPPEALDAWTHYHRAQGHILFTRNAERLDSAVAELKQAIRLESRYAAARSLLASVYTMRSLWGIHPRAGLERKEAVRLSRSALRLEPDNSAVLINCADTTLYSAGDLNGSLRLLGRAVAIDPSDAHGLALFANVNRCASGDIDKSLEFLKSAMRLSPRDPRSHRWFHYAAWAYWKQRNLHEMEKAARQAISLYSDAPAQWIALTCSLGLQRRTREAAKAAGILKGMIPGFSAEAFFELSRHFYKERFVEEEEGYRELCLVLQDALTPKS